MDNPRLRVFALALCGVALGIALSKFSGGSLAVIVAIVVAIGCFLLFRMRSGR